MQIHNTVLALQIMNGVKVYAVQYLTPDTPSGTRRSIEDDAAASWGRTPVTSKSYHYKSAETYAPGTWVVVPTHKGKRFSLAKIVGEVVDVDFDDGVKLLWINQEIADPLALYKEHDDHDVTARRKLAASQAMNAAKEHLDTLGVDASAFAIEHKVEEGK